MDIVTIDETTGLDVSVDISGDTITIAPTIVSGGDNNHAVLINRNIADQHSIAAITGLQAEITKITTNTGGIGELNDLMSTSWQQGAVISINGGDNTKFDVTAGVGWHIDHSTHPVTVTEVTVAAQTAVAVTNLATQLTTEIAVDKNGNLIQQFRFTSEERRDVFTIGSMNHSNLSSILSVQPLARVLSHEVALTTTDLALAVGPLNIDGVIFQPNGANLNLNMTSGTTFSIGVDKTKIKDSNYINSIAQLATNFILVWQDGSGGFTLAGTDTINPSNYDDGTGGVLVPNGTMLPNKWQLLRVYVFPVETPGTSTVVIHYGTAVFGTAEEALSDLGVDFIPIPVLTNATHRANIAVKTAATDLSSSADAIIQTVGRFGHVGGGGAGGAGVTDHELLSGLLGGATNDHQHLTTAELAKLTGIEDNATADQTKADIDGLGVDAETLDGLDSTAFELTSRKDATGGYAGLTLFQINFKNILNTFTSFFTNSNTAARTYTFQDRNGTIADNTDLAGKEDADVDILKADTTDELTVGYTTTVEALGSDTITPSFETQSLKTRTTAGNITINNPSTGQGVIHIVFTIDGTDRTVTYGTEVKPVVGAATTLIASKVYLMTLVRDTSTHTIVSILEVA